MSHYDTLGVDSDATLEEIVRAYRRKCAEHHPDRNHGSDGSEMAAVNVAYAVLSDDVSRAEYDESGGGDKARERLKMLFDSYINDANGLPSHVNIVARFTTSVMDANSELDRIVKRAQSHSARLEREKTRVKGSDLFTTLCQKKIDDLDRRVSDATDEIELNNRVIELLSGLSDELFGSPQAGGSGTSVVYGMLPKWG